MPFEPLKNVNLPSVKYTVGAEPMLNEMMKQTKYHTEAYWDEKTTDTGYHCFSRIGTTIATAAFELIALIENAVKLPFIAVTATFVELPVLGVSLLFRLVCLTSVAESIQNSQKNVPGLIDFGYTVYKIVGFALGFFSTLIVGLLDLLLVTDWNYTLHDKTGLLNHDLLQKVKKEIVIEKVLVPGLCDHSELEEKLRKNTEELEQKKAELVALQKELPANKKKALENELKEIRKELYSELLKFVAEGERPKTLAMINDPNIKEDDLENLMGIYEPDNLAVHPVIGGLPSNPAQTDDQSKHIQTLIQKRKEIKAELAKFDLVESKIQSLQEQLQQKEAELSNEHAAKSTLETEIASLKQKITDLQNAKPAESVEASAHDHEKLESLDELLVKELQEKIAKLTENNKTLSGQIEKLNNEKTQRIEDKIKIENSLGAQLALNQKNLELKAFVKEVREAKKAVRDGIRIIKPDAAVLTDKEIEEQTNDKSMHGLMVDLKDDVIRVKAELTSMKKENRSPSSKGAQPDAATEKAYKDLKELCEKQMQMLKDAKENSNKQDEKLKEKELEIAKKERLIKEISDANLEYQELFKEHFPGESQETMVGSVFMTPAKGRQSTSLAPSPDSSVVFPGTPTIKVQATQNPGGAPLAKKQGRK